MNCPHCSVHIDEHEASRCLDAWVAEVVMGHSDIRKREESWEYCLYTGDCHEPYGVNCFFSTSIAAAWVVVMYFKDKQYPVELTGEDAHGWSRWDFRIWHPLDDPDFKDEIARGWDESMDLNKRIASASLAICRAAIKVKGNSR